MSGGGKGADRFPTPLPKIPNLEIAYDDLERIGRIGRGGNADVYKARIRSDGNEFVIAIKEPRFQQETIHADVVDRFTNEAETWASLDSHDHIVDVIDWDSTPLPWIALEYMDGGSLRDRIGETPLYEGVWIGIYTAKAIRYAHRHGVAHLDIKPENILFKSTAEEYWDVPKVSDWGLARLMINQSKSIEGVSPRYAAPEQFDPETYGEPDDFTDIYQLGVVLYELLTGVPPFSGTPTAVMRAVIGEPPPPPTSKNAALPDITTDVLTKALAKHKSDRYESVLDFRRALETLVDAVGVPPDLVGSLDGGDGQSGSSHPATESATIAATPSAHGDEPGEENATELGEPADSRESADLDSNGEENGNGRTGGIIGRYSRRSMLKAGAGILTVATVSAWAGQFGGNSEKTNDIKSGTDTNGIPPTTRTDDTSPGTDTRESQGNGTSDNTGPDTLVLIGYPQSGVQILKDFYSDFETDIPVLVTDGLKDPDLPENVGNDMSNVSGTAPAPTGPGAEEYARLYESEYGRKPGAFTAHTFDASAILMLANAAAGENDATAVRDQMTTVANPEGDEFTPAQLPEALDAVAAGQNITYGGASSACDFDDRGDMSSVSYSIFAFENEAISTLRTVQLSTQAASLTGTPPGGTGRSVQHGLLLPLTGDLGPLGRPMRDAGTLAGKIARDNTSNLTIDFHVADTETDPDAGVSAANSLVNAGYPSVNGPASSGVNLSVSKQVWIPTRTVGCSPSSTSPAVSGLQDEDYVWRIAPSDALQGKVLARIARESKAANSAATLFVNNSYGQALSKSFADSFEKRGGTIKDQVSFEMKQLSYTSRLEQALN